MKQQQSKQAWLGGIVALGLAGLSAGCQPAQQAEVRQDVRGVRESLDQAAESALNVAANATVASKVKATLGSWKGLDASAINVDVKDGLVILKGDVKQSEQADLAERVAIQVEGVQRVENQLTIRVPAKSFPTGGTAAEGTSP